MSKFITVVIGTVALSLTATHANPDSSANAAAQPVISANRTETLNGSMLPSSSRQWAIGVSAGEQAIASRFYEDGNTEFWESRFAQALKKYREAIKHWDHPAIRFNMAICLINLNQFVEAKENLDRGLMYGAAPLSEAIYREGLIYRKLLNTKLARITLMCKENLAEVTLDGESVLIAPGKVTRYLVPGDHQVVATKPGFLTTTKTLTLAPEQDLSFRVDLVAYSSPLRTTRRWPRWEPFAILAAGGITSGLGALAYRSSARNFAKYDDLIRMHCMRGCSPLQIKIQRETFGDVKETAEAQRVIAYSVFAISGVTLTVGAFMLYLNRPSRLHTRTLPLLGVTPTSNGGTVLFHWRL